MNINGYIKKIGNKTFDDFPFNEVDSLILSELSYVNLSLIVPCSLDANKFIYIGDITDKDLPLINNISVDDKFNVVMLKLMINSVRYKNIKICFSHEVFSKETATQFAAFTFVLPNNISYIAYRGTDITLTGWKEDMLMSYGAVTYAQKEALEYANRVMYLLDGPFYLGGHSKGGNLAVYALLHLRKEFANRIIRTYTFDGPGLRDNQYNKEIFDALKIKINKYMTSRDVIGAIYNIIEYPIIIVSHGALFGGHDPFYWKVDGRTGLFIRAKRRSKASLKNEIIFREWLSEISDEDKQLAVRAIFQIFDYDDIYQFKRNFIKSIVKRKKVIQDNFTNEEIERLKNVFQILKKHLKEVK